MGLGTFGLHPPSSVLPAPAPIVYYLWGGTGRCFQGSGEQILLLPYHFEKDLPKQGGPGPCLPVLLWPRPGPGGGRAGWGGAAPSLLPCCVPWFLSTLPLYQPLAAEPRALLTPSPELWSHLKVWAVL